MCWGGVSPSSHSFSDSDSSISNSPDDPSEDSDAGSTGDTKGDDNSVVDSGEITGGDSGTDIGEGEEEERKWDGE